MRALDCLGYLFGQRQAIETVARSRAALPTGIVLVLLTSIARNYDQTWLLESPLRWLFGSLAFSTVSGWLLYAIAWRGMLKRSGHEESGPPGPSGGWAGFMGLFWLTAPIAWLYAIPVERFLNDVDAARANVALLATVSLWRVLLMVRVFQVLARAPFLMALFWVLLVASAEAMLVFFFGGGMAKAIMAGMGGMRNSPAEDVLLHAMGFAASGAFWTFLIAVVGAIVVKARTPLTSLPATEPGRMPWKFSAMAVSFWIAIAIIPQRELFHNVSLQQLIEAGEHRKALDYLNARQPGDFGPARTLAPLPYERAIFEQLPPLIAAAAEQDAPWVREHLVRRLDEMADHIANRWRARRGLRKLIEIPPGELATNLFNNLYYFQSRPGPYLEIIEGLQRFPEGRAWLAANRPFLTALNDLAHQPPERRHSSGQMIEETNPGWTNLAHHLFALGITNISSRATTNSPP